jgi:PEP-CTERM motif
MYTSLLQGSQNRRRRATRIITLALKAGPLFLVPSVFAATIVNGSFEAVQIGSPFFSVNPSDIPGWTHSGTVGDALLWSVGYADGGGSATTAGDGRQFVTLGGGFDAAGSATWSTMITSLVAGDSYVLSFMTATESGYAGGPEPGGPQTMTVGFSSGSSTLPESFTSPLSSANYWRVWVAQSYTFEATAASAIVDFSVTNQQYDVGLDNVTVAPVAAVPEPSGLSLIGLSLLAFAIRRNSASG